MVFELMSPEIRKQIDEMDEVIHRLERAKEALQRKIQELMALQSPIKLGDIIEWDTGKRVYRGEVQRILNEYHGYAYVCYILSKDGRYIGRARVQESNNPVLTDWRPEPATVEKDLPKK